jgi:dienelactone hydrolase
VTTVYPIDHSRWEVWGLRDRQLPLEIWYPATGEAGIPNDLPAMVGPAPDWAWFLLQLVYGGQYDDLMSIVTDARRDDVPVTSAGPFPVILFSHGLSALRFQSWTLCEHLASHGFVVVAPDHYDNTIFTVMRDGEVILFNPISTITGVFDRPEDVDFIYHWLLNLWDDGRLEGSIPMDLDRFGVAGHSYGGLTSMLVGPMYDYIDAIAPMNPLFIDWYPDDFDRPFLMLQSEKDEIVGMFNGWTRGAFDQASSDRKVHILLKNGCHYSATNACTLLPVWLAPLFTECGNPDMIDPVLANYINDAYMTAFFKTVLYDDERYQPYLEVNPFPQEVVLTAKWAD